MKTIKTIFLSLILMVLFLPGYTQSVASNTSIDNIAKTYFGLKNALAADDARIAANKAQELLAILSSQPDKNMKPAQQKLLSRFMDKLKYDSRHISETTMIDHQRAHFASLSKNLYEVLNGLKMNTTTIYEQYCPMKKAYWLSETQTIKNPYYGKKMLECGKTTATLSR